VLPRRQFGDDAAPFAVNGRLGGDDIRADRPRAPGVACFGDDGRRRFVARGFDGQQVKTTASNARFSVSENGGRNMPFSVMMPAM
jgi:hypothetical protein